MTTAVYLESLQNDLERTVTALDLEEGTNFTNIADMAENGDISTGGGADLSEYFVTQWNENTSSSNKIVWDVKKYADMQIGSNVTTLDNGFYYNRGIEILPRLVFGNNVTNVKELYLTCTGIKTVDMSMWDISNITTFNRMCSGCTALLNVIPPLTTSIQMCDVSYVFQSCSNLTSLDLSNWKVNVANNVSYFFRSCSKLTYVDIRNIKLSMTNPNVVGLFYGCTSLTHADIRGMDFVSAQPASIINMFYQVPTNCEIIVKDSANKTWINTNFPEMTNVKTVVEYEGE